MIMDRAEHLAWAKERALSYLDAGEIANAIASMLSDMAKHDELAGHEGIQLTGMLLLGGLIFEPDAVRRHIEGFR